MSDLTTIKWKDIRDYIKKELPKPGSRVYVSITEESGRTIWFPITAIHTIPDKPKDSIVFKLGCRVKKI